MKRAHVPAELRRQVRQRSGGRCEYCLIPEAMTLAILEVDHVIARKHGGATHLDNLADACNFCNEFKGSDLASVDPETGTIVLLFNPRRDRWSEHFRLAVGRIEGLTPVGRATARLLQFNHADRAEERELLIAAGLFLPPKESGQAEAIP